jgi:predicted enzyme related to lactoylglutathione lyase
MSFSSRPLVGKVVWHDLVTEDLPAAQRFYGGLFGWTFEEAGGPDRAGYSLARAGNVYVAGLVPIASPADGSRLSRWLPYVSVPDVDVAVGNAVDAGGRVAVSARDVALGRVAALVDPEGAVIGIARSDVGDPDDRTTAPGPGRVVWSELLSNDPQAAAAFYEKLIGYEARASERRGDEYLLLQAGNVDRAGILKNPTENWDPLWLTYFGVDDPAKAAQRAEELGGTILLAASPEVRDGTMAVVTDPSGAVLVLRKWSL